MEKTNLCLTLSMGGLIIKLDYKIGGVYSGKQKHFRKT